MFQGKEVLAMPQVSLLTLSLCFSVPTIRLISSPHLTAQILRVLSLFAFPLLGMAFPALIFLFLNL